ncbi:hypothetical protein SAMN06265361_105110 [Laceyella tengchongensis]|uniref:Uncharacterized protein n=1 Tax=Laceyella tengchongensis TaxID=574699 RepID=A0AA46AG96_9BACL|nr:hypothetical protein SAMN06265361_105110 [Laceyella tengchongensis]
MSFTNYFTRKPYYFSYNMTIVRTTVLIIRPIADNSHDYGAQHFSD